MLAVLLLAGASAAYHAPVAPRGTLHTHRMRPQLVMQQPEPSGEAVVRGVGPGRELPSPSGINQLPEPLQAAFVVAVLSAVGFGAAVLSGPVFDSLRDSFLWNLSRPTWPLLGFIYLAAGIAHFTEAEGFENITPPNKTWGFYYTPFSPRVNVYWTGVVEIFGGAWMLFGFGAKLAGIALPPELGPVVSDGALTLFLLTIFVVSADWLEHVPPNSHGPVPHTSHFPISRVARARPTDSCEHLCTDARCQLPSRRGDAASCARGPTCIPVCPSGHVLGDGWPDDH